MVEIALVEKFLVTNKLHVPAGVVNKTDESTVQKRLDVLVAEVRKDEDTVFIEHGRARKVSQFACR
jgi:hypothetical protein